MHVLERHDNMKALNSKQVNAYNTYQNQIFNMPFLMRIFHGINLFIQKTLAKFFDTY